LLESFKHLFAYDSGIAFGLGTGLTKRLKKLTSTKSFAEANNIIIHYLALGALSNIAMNQQGKQECVD
jgi:maltodextrin utilization protein YvdJ